MTVPNLLTHAISYAARGWRIHPIHWLTPEGTCSCGNDACERSKAKHPLIADWPKVATIDTDQIKRWWRKWPQAGIGIVTGASSGICVLDVDPRNGGDRGAFEQAYGKLPETPQVVSGSGGTHDYFLCPGYLPSPKLGHGIDFLADGNHYVIAPRSIHPSGNRYEWELSADIDDTPIAELPSWVLELVQQHASSATRAAQALPHDLPELEVRSLKVSNRVKRIISEGETKGKRSEALATVYTAMHHAGYSQAEIASIVLDPGNGISEKIWEQKNPRSPTYDEQTRGWVAQDIARVLSKTVATPNPHQPARQSTPLLYNVPAPDSVKTPRQPVFVNASDIVPQAIRWLWEPYLARGMIAMLDGDPGVGKSLLTIQLAACISRGWPLPDQQGKPTFPVDPGRVLFLIAEESHSYTFRPRLDSAGADCEQIRILTGFLGEEDEELAFTFQHMDVLQRATEIFQPDLIIIDPIQAYVGAINISRSNETRPLLTALRQVAENSGASILCLRHLAKDTQGGGKAMLRGLGSVDFIGAARTGLLVEQHPLDSTKAILMQSKSNISFKGRTQIFSKDEGFFQWCGVTRANDETLAGTGRGPDPYAFLEAMFWLEAELESGTPQPSDDVIHRAGIEGISEKTLKRAKKALDIKSIRSNDVWYYKLNTLEIKKLNTPPILPGPLVPLDLLDPLGPLDPLEENQSLMTNGEQEGQGGQQGQEGQGGQVGQVLSRVPVFRPEDARAHDAKNVPANDHELEVLFQIEDENARDGEEGRG